MSGRPTASRRAVRRRYAVMGVLADLGPSSATEVSLKLHRGFGVTLLDLDWMAHHGLVESFEDSGPHPRIRRYRLRSGGGGAA